MISHLFGHLMVTTTDQTLPLAVMMTVVLILMSVASIWSTLIKGTVAVKKELQQLHNMSTFVPMDATKLTRKQRADALSSHIHLTKQMRR